MHFVYVLQSQKTKRFYIGYTLNPKTRLNKHNRGENTSTKHGRSWKLIYLEGYLVKADALGRERFLKSGSGHRYIHKQLKNYFDTTV